jgi:hypothetical protein
MDCFVASLPCANALRLSQAMTALEKSGARGLGGRVEPRALWKEEVGEVSSFQPTSTQ